MTSKAFLGGILSVCCLDLAALRRQAFPVPAGQGVKATKGAQLLFDQDGWMLFPPGIYGRANRPSGPDNARVISRRFRRPGFSAKPSGQRRLISRTDHGLG